MKNTENSKEEYNELLQSIANAAGIPVRYLFGDLEKQDKQENDGKMIFNKKLTEECTINTTGKKLPLYTNMKCYETYDVFSVLVPGIPKEDISLQLNMDNSISISINKFITFDAPYIVEREDFLLDYKKTNKIKLNKLYDFNKGISVEINDGIMDIKLYKLLHQRQEINNSIPIVII